MSTNVTWHDGEVGRGDRPSQGATVWLTGLSGSGKSTVAVALERKGMLRIVPDERDARARRLEATEAGQRNILDDVIFQHCRAPELLGASDSILLTERQSRGLA